MALFYRAPCCLQTQRRWLRLAVVQRGRSDNSPVTLTRGMPQHGEEHCVPQTSRMHQPPKSLLSPTLGHIELYRTSRIFAISCFNVPSTTCLTIRTNEYDTILIDTHLILFWSLISGEAGFAVVLSRPSASWGILIP